MTIWQTAMLALGLSADACAVSLANGMTVNRVVWRGALKTGIFFGGFQALMTYLGFQIGKIIIKYVEPIAPWIAFALLVFIGVQMIRESTRENNEVSDCLKTSRLFFCAIATSIDAFAAGISVSVLNISIFSVAMSIGLTTFALSVIAVFLGKRLNNVFNKHASAVGGIFLIIIGLTIILEHFGIIGV